MAYTNVWDDSVPLDTQAANQGAADFRQTKLDIMQRVASFGAGLLASRPTPEVTSATADWTGVMYWATDTQQTFMWTGSAWTDISTSLPTGIATALATTGSPVNVSLASPPSSGQVLKATDATHATWQTLSVPSIPTLSIKRGSGSGAYNITSPTFVAVDGTNLTYTVVIPVGWVLSVVVTGMAEDSQNGQVHSIAIVDGSTVLTNVNIFNASGGSIQPIVPFSIAALIIGDGSSHTVTLQSSVTSAAFTTTIVNDSVPDSPAMLFMLTQSN